MRPFSRRALIQAQSAARNGLRIRFEIHIERPKPALVQNSGVVDLLANAQEPTATSDTLVLGSGVFEESRDTLETQDTGTVRLRRGTIACHARYKEAFESGYAVVIGGQRGVWNITGVVGDITQTQLTVYVQGRQ
jgi:hypothetical protein